MLDVLQCGLQRKPRVDLRAVRCLYLGLVAFCIVEGQKFFTGKVIGDCDTGDVVVPPIE